MNVKVTSEGACLPERVCRFPTYFADQQISIQPSPEHLRMSTLEKRSGNTRIPRFDIDSRSRCLVRVYTSTPADNGSFQSSRNELARRRRGRYVQPQVIEKKQSPIDLASRMKGVSASRESEHDIDFHPQPHHA